MALTKCTQHPLIVAAVQVGHALIEGARGIEDQHGLLATNPPRPRLPQLPMSALRSLKRPKTFQLLARGFQPREPCSLCGTGTQRLGLLESKSWKRMLASSTPSLCITCSSISKQQLQGRGASTASAGMKISAGVPSDRTKRIRHCCKIACLCERLEETGAWACIYTKQETFYDIIQHTLSIAIFVYTLNLGISTSHAVSHV